MVLELGKPPVSWKSGPFLRGDINFSANGTEKLFFFPHFISWSGSNLPTILLKDNNLEEESEKVKVRVESDSLQSHGLSMEFSRPEYWSG